MKKLEYFVLGVVFLFISAGCKKNQQIDLVPDLNVSNDLILSTRPFTYTLGLLVKAVADSSLQASKHAVIDFATVSLDIKKQKYTFSYTGNLCADSVWRSGSFIATIDSGFYHHGTRIKFSFQGYFEDGHQVTGNDSLFCNGIVGGLYQYNHFIAGAVITKDSARTIKFNAAWQVSVGLAATVQGVSQTVISFDGTSGGVSSGGYTFTSEIKNALILYENCPWICDGLMVVSIAGAEIPAGTIEFLAKTNCNDQIKYDFEGNIYKMRIKEKYLYL